MIRLIRSLGLALFASTSAPSLLAQELFFDGFESGTSSWTLTSLWNPESDTDACGSALTPFPSASSCVVYGAQPPYCDYLEGFNPTGELTLVVPVQLPPAAVGRKAWLHYWNILNSEHCPKGSYDISYIGVSTNGGATWNQTADCSPNNPSLSWARAHRDLTAYLGQSVLVRFTFYEGDGVFDGYWGWWIDDVAIRVETGERSCGQSNACPCGNYSVNVEDAVAGCKNSTQAGAELWANGAASVSADSLVLEVERVPTSSPLVFVQGASSIAPVVFGDGLRCIGGRLVRMSVKTAVNGRARFPEPGDTFVSRAGHVPDAGGTRYYQVYFRDAAPFCTSATFNLSNGWRIDWQP